MNLTNLQLKIATDYARHPLYRRYISAKQFLSGLGLVFEINDLNSLRDNYDFNEIKISLHYLIPDAEVRELLPLDYVPATPHCINELLSFAGVNSTPAHISTALFDVF